MNWKIRMRRIATALIALFVAAGVGVAIALHVIEPLVDPLVRMLGLSTDGYDIGTFLALVGFVLLILKDSLLALVNTWGYIWNDEGSPPQPRETAVWLIEAIVATAILVAVLSVPQKDCPRDWKACVLEANSLNRACFLECMRDREVNYLTAHITQSKTEILVDHKEATLKRIASAPLLFYNAQKDIEGGLSETSHGVALQPGHADQLRRIAEVFEENCPRPRNATLRVVGSSSEAPFRNETRGTSNALNVRAAYLRAKNVAPKLDKALNEVGLGGMEIKLGLLLGHGEEVSKPSDEPPELLEEFEKMRRSAFPGVDYLALADPQHQARSVFVEVVNPSACFENPNP